MPTTETDRYAWLSSLFIPDSGWREHPFALRVDGETWRAATNGHVLVAVRAPIDGTHEIPESPRRHMSSLLTPDASALEVDTSALLAWADIDPARMPPSCGRCRATGRRTCSECRGNGSTRCDHDYDHDCVTCEGSGIEACDHRPMSPHYRPGRIGEAHYNRDLFWPLKYLPGPARLRPGSTVNGTPLLLLGDGWRMVVMPMRVQDECAPVFVIGAAA